MPIFDAAPIPVKNASGTLISIAHGQLITSIVSALYAQVAKSGFTCINRYCASDGNANVSAAMIQTIGVYTFAKLLINVSDLDFFSVAFSIKSKILLAVESLNSFLTWTLMTLSLFISPLATLSPTVTYLGMLSPVIIAVFKVVAPSIISPSIGIFS